MFEITHLYLGVLVRKNKQFFPDYNRGRRFFFASFRNCSYVWIVEIEDWPAHPGLWRVFGCGNEGSDLVTPLKKDFIDLIIPLFYNRLQFTKEVIE